MKNLLYIVIGILVAVTAFHVYYLYNLNGRIVSLENFSIQVANLINQSQVKK